jgi:hypothetical protein
MISRPPSSESSAAVAVRIWWRRPALPETVLLKVGTLDQPEVFGQATIAVHTLDGQSFHKVAEGITAFERLPN